MIGIILVGHGKIATEMLHAVEHVAGPQENTAALDVPADADVNDLRTSLRKRIQQCDNGNGVLIFADMFGGTPCNIALASLGDKEIKLKGEVISGFNLPMIIKAVTLRDTETDILNLANEAREAGRYHMHMASEIMNSSSKKTQNA